eukprot:TRINITY_DN1076_c0_g1_i1.p1 TRINITY_DN1076_c0_g1~~TRINITY_DN1076_c0_g1_i1.p1  ORF type:complete len:395 (-),score=78.37 TRINITY_DN1076_c0_g1_i1:164-1234(-)
MFVIFAYVIGWTIVWEKRYLLNGTPTGSVRMSLLQPKDPIAPAKLEYCKVPGSNDTNDPFTRYECRYWDESFVVFPAAEDHDMFITTRVREEDQTLDGCSLTDPDCHYKIVDNSTFFIGDIEQFSLELDHTMYVPNLNKQGTSQTMPGRMLDSHGNEMKLDHLGKVGSPDRLLVSDLLKAAGVDSLTSPSETKPGISMRDDGIVLLMFIDYSNTFTWDLSQIRYTYTVKLVNKAKFKVTQPIFTKKVDDRKLWVRHGVRLIILHTGEVGVFDFPTLLLSFVSGLGLMAVATLVVDTFATKILPAKNVYNRYKYEETKEINHKLFDSDESVSISQPIDLDSDPTYDTFNYQTDSTNF